MSDAHKADAELMKQVAAGNPQACRALLEAHLAPAYRLAFGIVGRADRAEDIAQEAMLRLWKAAPRWQAKAKLSTWLYRVTHNLAIDEKRKLERESGTEMPEMADPAPGVIAAHAAAQDASALEQAIALLPERQGIAIRLIYFEELAQAEAAEIMSITPVALDSLVARARRGLKAHLEGMR
ncbi:MAG: sigma-70 family RNA polymerase sigma factor [Alphaproteobacteria bacterium]